MSKNAHDALPTIADPLPTLSAPGGLVRLQNMIMKQPTGPGRVTDDERVFLEECEKALNAGLRPVKPKVILEEVEALIAFYPSRPQSEDVVARMGSKWVRCLGHLPEDVLKTACGLYLKSTARQAPTPGLILEIAQPVVDARLFLSRQVGRLLTEERIPHADD
jgi:hypothetical protein